VGAGVDLNPPNYLSHNKGKSRPPKVGRTSSRR